MSAAGARSATKKASKIVLSAAALTAAIGLGTAAVIFGPAAAINREPDRAAQLDPRQGPQFVQIAVAKPAGASERTFTGIISARVQSNLGFRVPGKVVERLVDVGQEVHAGQPLMRLDQKDLDLALTAKENAVAAARARPPRQGPTKCAIASLRPTAGPVGRDMSRPRRPSTPRPRNWPPLKPKPMSRETKPDIRCCSLTPMALSSRPWPNPGRWSPPARPW